MSFEVETFESCMDLEKDIELFKDEAHFTGVQYLCTHH